MEAPFWRQNIESEDSDNGYSPRSCRSRSSNSLTLASAWTRACVPGPYQVYDGDRKVAEVTYEVTP